MHSDWRSKNGQLKIGLASDHGGFEKKNQLLELVTQLGYEAVDFGPFAQDPADDYPDFANPLCQNLMRGRLDCGILICRSGIGMSIFANRFHGVRAALCETVAKAKADADEQARIKAEQNAAQHNGTDNIQDLKVEEFTDSVTEIQGSDNSDGDASNN